MGFATQLPRAMTAPDFECDIGYRDVSRISGQEIGTLLPAACTVSLSGGHSARPSGSAVTREGRERQPRYTTEAYRRMFEALVTQLKERRGRTSRSERSPWCAARPPCPTSPTAPAH